MEPVTVVSTIISLLVTGGAEGLGKDIKNKILAFIQDKFKANKKEWLITRAEEQPTESNIAEVKLELENQINQDKDFALKLEALLKESAFTRLTMVGNVKAQKGIEIRDAEQKAKQKSSIEMSMFGDLEANEDIRLESLTQELE